MLTRKVIANSRRKGSRSNSNNALALAVTVRGCERKDNKRRKGEADRDICIITVRGLQVVSTVNTYHGDGLLCGKVIHEHGLCGWFCGMERSYQPQRDIGVPAYPCHTCMHTRKYAGCTLRPYGMLRFRRTSIIIRCADVSLIAARASPIIMLHRLFLYYKTAVIPNLRLLGFFHARRIRSGKSHIWDPI